jgi:hypothetical protein
MYYDTDIYNIENIKDEKDKSFLKGIDYVASDIVDAGVLSYIENSDNPSATQMAVVKEILDNFKDFFKEYINIAKTEICATMINNDTEVKEI